MTIWTAVLIVFVPVILFFVFAIFCGFRLSSRFSREEERREMERELEGLRRTLADPMWGTDLVVQDDS